MEIGEYIRTKKGLIGMVIKIREGKCINKYRNYLIDWGNGKATYRTAIKDIKHSKNIIDLIEVGDYVNKSKVLAVGDVVITQTSNIEDENFNLIEGKDIKSILTKEQYEQNSFKI